MNLWACATSLYRMFTGEAPRDFPASADPWWTVLSTSAVPIRQRQPAVPKKLAEVIDHALVDKPEIQIRTAIAFKRLLEGAV